MKKWIVIGVSAFALLTLLTWSGIICGKTSALLGAIAAGGAAKLTSARLKVDETLEQMKTTTDSAKKYSKTTDEEVANAREKAYTITLDELIAAANERERNRQNTTIR